MSRESDKRRYERIRQDPEKYREYMNKVNTRISRLKKQRIELGLCSKCGAKRIDERYKMCDACRKRSKIWNQKKDPERLKRRRESIRKSSRRRYYALKAQKRCPKCERPTLSEKYVSCQTCRTLECNKRRNTMITITCVHCKNRVRVIKSYRTIHCSKECYNAARHQATIIRQKRDDMTSTIHD